MIKIEFSMPRFDQRFKEMQGEIMLVLAASMQTNRAMMFDKDGADNGKPPWAPLKWRQGHPLQKTGTLRKSFAPVNDGIKPGFGRDSIVEINGMQVQIGTKLLYAGMMNDGTTKLPGGVLRPTHAKALRFPVPQGEKGKYMFRKSVKISARPMDTITQQDQDEWSETLANFIAERLNE